MLAFKVFSLLQKSHSWRTRRGDQPESRPGRVETQAWTIDHEAARGRSKMVVSTEPVPVPNVTALKSRYLGTQRNCLKELVPVPNVTALKSR